MKAYPENREANSVRRFLLYISKDFNSGNDQNTSFACENGQAAVTSLLGLPNQMGGSFFTDFANINQLTYN